MKNNVRPNSMERITTEKLAKEYIDKQVKLRGVDKNGFKEF